MGTMGHEEGRRSNPAAGRGAYPKYANGRWLSGTLK
jgi:hypothetical protein